jgi:hypothetical protein
VDAVDRQALVDAALQAGEERLDDLLVLLDLEQQRHVDVDALVQGLGDRREALVGARDLDHQVGTVDAVPVLLGLRDGLVGVERQVGVDLQRDVAVVAVGLVIDGAQDVGRGLDVLDGDGLVDGARVLGGQTGDLGVVLLAAEDGFLEDRGVGGHPAQGVFLHHAGQFTTLDELALDLVEPDAGAQRGKAREAFIDGCGVAHGGGLLGLSHSILRPDSRGHPAFHELSTS